MWNEKKKRQNKWITNKKNDKNTNKKKKNDKACFADDAAYSDSKDLAKTSILDKIWEDRAEEIARNRWYDGYQRALTSIVYRFFDKKTESGAIATSKSGINVNEQLAEELHKPATKIFKRKKVYARFKDKVWAADLAETDQFLQKIEMLNIYYVW